MIDSPKLTTESIEVSVNNCNSYILSDEAVGDITGTLVILLILWFMCKG